MFHKRDWFLCVLNFVMTWLIFFYWTSSRMTICGYSIRTVHARKIHFSYFWLNYLNLFYTWNETFLGCFKDRMTSIWRLKATSNHDKYGKSNSLLVTSFSNIIIIASNVKIIKKMEYKPYILFFRTNTIGVQVKLITKFIIDTTSNE